MTSIIVFIASVNFIYLSATLSRYFGYLELNVRNSRLIKLNAI